MAEWAEFFFKNKMKNQKQNHRPAVLANAKHSAIFFNLPAPTQTTTAKVRRKVPITEEELLSRVGQAKELCTREQIANPKYSSAIWDEHLTQLLDKKGIFQKAMDERKELSHIKKAILPKVQKLLSRLRKVFSGNLGSDHRDVVGTLAAHLKGRSGRTLDHLKALHNYHLNHQEEVSLSPELASKPYEQYITQLEKYGSDALNAKKETEKDASNVYTTLQSSRHQKL